MVSHGSNFYVIKIMNNKNILVTGGAGFIGSHLCEQLAKDASNRVVSLDNYSMGSESNHVNLDYIKGDKKI